MLDGVVCVVGVVVVVVVCDPEGTGAGGGTLLTGGCGGTLSWFALEDGDVVCPTPKTLKRNKKRIAKGSLRSFRWCIVSRLGINLQRRQSLRGIELNFDLTPFAVSYRVLWTVAEHILVA